MSGNTAQLKTEISFGIVFFVIIIVITVEE